jgi:hypothetical protein
MSATSRHAFEYSDAAATSRGTFVARLSLPPSLPPSLPSHLLRLLISLPPSLLPSLPRNSCSSSSRAGPPACGSAAAASLPCQWTFY